MINLNLKLKKEDYLKKERRYFRGPRYYVEEIRKNTIKKFGYDKVYKEGLNIKTPLNLELQKKASNALRNGILNYDKRNEWRGSIIK